MGDADGRLVTIGKWLLPLFFPPFLHMTVHRSREILLVWKGGKRGGKREKRKRRFKVQFLHSFLDIG